MAVREIPILKESENWEIFQAARDDLSDEYRRRIPEATKSRQRKTVEKLQEFRPLRNEFAAWLVNKIGATYAHQISWTNPLAEFKRGFLYEGDTIEETSLDLITATSYDPDREVMEKTLFGTHKMPGQSAYHRVNRMDRYDITINRPMLTRAFNEAGGLNSLITEMMSIPTTSDNQDEFLLTCSLFNLYESNGGFFKINVPNISVLSSNEDEAKKALRTLRATARNLTFLSTKYNAAKQNKAAAADDLVIFCTPEFEAAVDVEALAGAFNTDKANMVGRIIPIPKERFGITGVQAIMTTKDFFVIADTLFETSTMDNPGNLQQNHFLHHHGIISASPFVPAIIFWTGPGDDDAIEIDPIASVLTPTVTNRENELVTEVLRGESYNLLSNALTLNEREDGVMWTVEGAQDWRTNVTQEGVLHVSGIETAASLTLRATASFVNPDDPMKDGISATVTVIVGGEFTARWPVANTDAAPSVSGLFVQDSAGLKPVSPAFDPDTLAYTVTTSGWDGAAESVVVAGVETGDVKVKVKADKSSFTVYAPGAPSDPTYTVTVTNTD